MNRVGVGILGTVQWMTNNNARMMKREMNRTPIQSIMMRMRKCSTLDHPESSEDEVGGDQETVMVPVSAGEALAHATPMRTHQERLNHEPLHVLFRKFLLHLRRFPLPQHLHISNNKLIL